ncbi:hypothetical protein TNCV_1492701 [Trichonephila clavipes]|nr:hypothetical protein TNCV_1492701 [Trichonephila clavipes]
MRTSLKPSTTAKSVDENTSLECLAFGKICAKCKKKNHFAAKCFQSTKNFHEMNVPEKELVYIDSVNENETKCAMKIVQTLNFKNVEMENAIVTEKAVYLVQAAKDLNLIKPRDISSVKWFENYYEARKAAK